MNKLHIKNSNSMLRIWRGRGSSNTYGLQINQKTSTLNVQTLQYEFCGILITDYSEMLHATLKREFIIKDTSDTIMCGQSFTPDDKPLHLIRRIDIITVASKLQKYLCGAEDNTQGYHDRVLLSYDFMNV